MPTEDNTQQTPNSNSQVIAAIRSLEDRVANVEQIIEARLNTTRPFEQQMLAQLNELVAGQARIQEQMAAMQGLMAAMREELTALREDFEKFRTETNHNFRLVNQKLEHLNNDFLNIRAEHALLEKRVSRLEEQAA